ncbi:MAG TPA: 2Fe-2S iron-sulfur cluster binding domain-containing protein, partial [Nannocystis exedens]|nr:2Fe-2S iron-sulfur cluster binding domain-containing protein [Nannocystis exedens]
GGRVSTYLNGGIQNGARLGLFGPAGAFTITPDPSRSRRLVLIGGGSGITPLITMIEALLAGEPGTEIFLIYGNRNPESILFRGALDEMVAENPGRLRISYLVERSQRGCTLALGLLDKNGLGAELEAVSWPLDDVDGWYVCGPEAVRKAARELLLGRGVEEHRLHEECFSSAPRRAVAAPARGMTSSLTIRRQGQAVGESRVLRVPAGSTILEAVSAAGESLPFSCAVGGCGACRVRLLEGEVAMDEPNCLSAEERAEGYILTCCGAPMGPCTIEVP